MRNIPWTSQICEPATVSIPSRQYCGARPSSLVCSSGATSTQRPLKGKIRTGRPRRSSSMIASSAAEQSRIGKQLLVSKREAPAQRWQGEPDQRKQDCGNSVAAGRLLGGTACDLGG